MSVRFTAASTYLSLTASLPAVDPLTVVCWIYIVTDRNAYSPIWEYLDSGAAHYEELFLASDGTSLRVATETGGTNGTSLSTGTWYWVAYRRSGSTHNALLTGVINAAHTNAGTWTPFAIVFGGDTVNFLDGRIACAKIWTAALSDAEIVTEGNQPAPARASNLYAYWPLQVHTDLADQSGNGHNLTANGSLSTEADPPIFMRRQAFMHLARLRQA